MTHRLKIIQGGSSAGKTIAILLILIDRAQCEKNKLFSIVSESVPHLKRGAIRDFLNIMEAHSYYQESNWNRTDYIYTFSTGTKIEFFSADNPDKVRGPRRDVLFLNEANNISYETYTQLVIRTNEDIFIDYNPVTEFWVHTEVKPKTEHDFVILTYKDNEGLPETIVKELESRKDRKGWWQVYGLGQLGEVDGKIYKDWQVIEGLPFEAKLERYGVDFGYSNDPTTVIAVYSYNGAYILDQIAYQKGLSNKEIADIILNKDKALVIADSSEPKSIDEIMRYGVTILGAQKGPDSINNGIAVVQAQRISMTSRSTDLIREYRNYLWMNDKNGKIINVPEEGFDHCLDAVRYAITSLLRATNSAPVVHQSNLKPYGTNRINPRKFSN